MKRFFFRALVPVMFTLVSCSIPEADPAYSPDLTVYPNPANAYVVLGTRNNSTQVYTLRVFNTDGDEILEETVSPGAESTFQLDLSTRKSGYYYAILDTGSKVIKRKFTKV